MAIVSLKCPNCDGSLSMEDSMKIGFCQFCGTKVIVQETIMPETIDYSHIIDNYLDLAKASSQSGNYEDVEKYANNILEIDSHNALGWQYKAKAVGWQSKINELRIFEASQCFLNSVKFSTEETSNNFSLEGFDELISISEAILELITNYFVKYPDSEETQRCIDTLNEIMKVLIYYQTVSGDVRRDISVFLNKIVVIFIKMSTRSGNAATAEYVEDAHNNEGHPSKYGAERCVESYMNRVLVLEHAYNTAYVKQYENARLMNQDPPYDNQIGMANGIISIISGAEVIKYHDYQYEQSFKSWSSHSAVSPQIRNLLASKKVYFDFQVKRLNKENIEYKKKKISLDKRKYWVEHPAELDKLIKEKQMCSEEIENLKTKRESLVNEKSKMGMFAIKQKKEIDDQIIIIDRSLGKRIQSIQQIEERL